MNRPALSVLIPWCDRPELARSLEANRQMLSAVDVEVVVVNCGGELAQLDAMVESTDLSSIVRVDLPGASFNKALALNVGAHVASADRLLVLDADVVPDPGFIADGMARLVSEIFVTLARVVESVPTAADDEPEHLFELAHQIELTLANDQVVRLESNRLRYADGSRSAPGMIMLRGDDFRRVDGMNSDLEGWGWEDLDLVARLQMSGLERVEIGRAVHLTHDDAARSFAGASPAHNEALNFARCVMNYRAGYFRGTWRDDVRQWSERLDVQRRT